LVGTSTMDIRSFVLERATLTLDGSTFGYATASEASVHPAFWNFIRKLT
jgi:hypothetical protein